VGKRDNKKKGRKRGKRIHKKTQSLGAKEVSYLRRDSGQGTDSRGGCSPEKISARRWGDRYKSEVPVERWREGKKKKHRADHLTKKAGRLGP